MTTTKGTAGNPFIDNDSPELAEYISALLSRVKTVFLNSGLLHRENYGDCHRTSAEMIERIIHGEAQLTNELPNGYVLYTRTDVNHLHKTGDLYLSFGCGFDQGEVDTLIGENLATSLMEAGLTVVWDYDYFHRILVRLPLQKQTGAWISCFSPNTPLGQQFG